MDDLVLNVRQIGQYPQKAAADGGDFVLLQTGGLGGPYAFVTSEGLVEGAMGTPGAELGVGIQLPGDSTNSGVIATQVTTPVGCAFGWGWYQGSGGQELLGGAAAARLCFDGTTLTFATGTGSPIAWTPQLTLAGGELTLPLQTLTVARDPAVPLEVATKQYADAIRAAATAQFNSLQSLYDTATVWSFNGRTGAITLSNADVVAAGAAPLANPHFTGTATFEGLTANSVQTQGLATGTLTANSGTVSDAPVGPADLANKAYVDQLRVDVMTGTVLSFNGRKGNVTLALSDITLCGGAPINSPQFVGDPSAPTISDPSCATNQLATTLFVQRASARAINQFLVGYPFLTAFNGRTGAITLRPDDILCAGGALIAITAEEPQCPPLGLLWVDPVNKTLNINTATGWFNPAASAVQEAPQDGRFYARQNGKWVPLLDDGEY